MNPFKHECKLCDNIICDENFKVIDDVIKNTLNVLLLKLTLENEIRNVICLLCFSKSLAAFNFKSMCLDRDKSIIPYIDSENTKAGDLKELYTKNENKQGGRILDDGEICRLCLQSMNSDHKSIQEVPLESIQIYIPEINFALTTNSRLCLKCHDALSLHSSFIKNCLEVEKNRNIEATVLQCYPRIKTEEVDIKSEHIDDETLSEIISNIKKEEHEEGNTSLHFHNTEETKSLSGLSDPKQVERNAQSTIVSFKSKECSYKITSGNEAAEIQVNKSDCSTRRIKRQNNHNEQHKSITKDCKKLQAYHCDKCTFNSTRKDAFIRHQLIHKEPSQVQMYECSDCDYKSIRKDHLKQHQLRHKDRSGMQKYKCDKCIYETVHKQELIRHQLKHKDPSEVQMFKCDKCKFMTKHRSSFRRHRLRHKDSSEVRMYECNECDYKSVIKSDFNRHLLKHKDPSQLQMHTCDICNFTTKHGRSLRLHQLRHKDPSQVQMYECDECDYRSVEKGSFTRHMLKHKDYSQVTTYACDRCIFITKHKANLKTHCLRHKDPSEVQIYGCDKCDYKSTQRGNLRKHILIHGDQT